MSRTNIDIDDTLIAQAMRLYALETKREAVQFALERLIGSGPMTVDEQLTMRGFGWHGELDDLRHDRDPDWSARAVD
jgi:Arc/MetJ family transcription regulator